MKLLGVIFSREGVRADPQKVQAVQDFPELTSKLSAQRFNGLTNYLSEFVPNYATITVPLYELCKGDIKNFVMNETQREAFYAVKKAVAIPCLLSWVKEDQPIYLETDASSVGFAGIAYQVDEYPIEDLPRLQQEYERYVDQPPEQISEEMLNIIKRYTEGEEVPEYDHTVPEVPKICGQMAKEEVERIKIPFLNTKLKIKRAKNKIFVPRLIFTSSKKFSESQQRSWSSLMKELSAILSIVEKKADILSMASQLIILTDCQAVTYLYQQGRSNSLMSRYLARLSNYPFKCLLRHKDGNKMVLADSFSRMYTLDNDELKSERISHQQGLLIKNPGP